MNALEIFYNQIIDEASTGRVDCYFMYNVLFNCSVPQLGIENVSNYDNSNIVVPTLRIHDIESFNDLLLTYLDKAMDFYKEELESIPEEELRQKALMTVLWSNATVEDFNNPVEFLKKRIDFFDCDKLMAYDGITFFSETLKSDITVNVLKSKLANETPYHLSIKLSDRTSLEEFQLPIVYMGISDDEAYFYAIQSDKKNINEGSYAKKINRLLYKVNDGLDVHEDTYENYGSGNLKDVSSSFVLAANIAMGIVNDIGIKKATIPSILITRWNGREISNDVKKRFNRLDLVEDEEELERIQSNLTEKHLRTFRRLDYHHSGINVSSYPFDSDTSMHMILSDFDTCDNKILDDTYSVKGSTKYIKR